ncbi:hypothetical protein OIU78_007573, partial [Salix suchowensis]
MGEGHHQTHQSL